PPLCPSTTLFRSLVVAEAHACDLAESRVRLLRRGRVHARADSALLGAALERWSLLLLLHALPALADQLVDGRHTSPCASGISASKKRGDPGPRRVRLKWPDRLKKLRVAPHLVKERPCFSGWAPAVRRQLPAGRAGPPAAEPAGLSPRVPPSPPPRRPAGRRARRGTARPPAARPPPPPRRRRVPR